VTDWTPLSGMIVVDLSQQLPGPFATLLLRTLGAHVIKVEPPSGDPARQIDPPMFARLAAGKEIVVLDLKREDDRDRLHDLVADADVFVEGFRPGVVQRLGADWETLSAINPRLIYCSLSGFGSSGPLADRPGHDLNFLALAAGLPAGISDGASLIRVPWVDLAAGTNASLAVVAALLSRAATGAGRHLDIAMLDAAAVWSTVKLPREGAEGAYGVFGSADGGRVAVSVLEQAMWERLCRAFEWTDWLADPTMAEHGHRRALAPEIAARLAQEIAARPARELVELAVRHDVAISRVNTIDEAATDPQIAARDLFPDAAHWRPLGPTAPALRLDSSGASV
jgi:crotonobetainyl-CoA:carnitine CoA-transferase CaiB-like acyl-CoA transferase